MTTEEQKIDSKIKNLENELENKQNKIKEYWNMILLSKAELENLEKRTKKEIEKNKKKAIEIFSKELLLTLDSLELTIENMPEIIKKNESNFITGLELTYKMLIKTLINNGIQTIQIKKNETLFDPLKHEAVKTIKNSSYNNNIIIEILQKGYTLNQKVIRTSKVTIIKNKK